MINADGSLGRIQRSVVLGPASDIRSRHEASLLLEDRLRLANLSAPSYRPLFRFDSFFEEWERVVLPLLRPATRRFYKEKAEGHLVPYFGNWRLSDIRTLDIQTFLNQKSARYSRSALQHFKATLSRLFADAIAWGYVRENPVRNVKLPNNGDFRSQPYLTPEQVRQLVENLREPCRTIVITAVLTGLRPSELFALSWPDLDFEKQSIHVRRSFYRGEFAMPKTTRSKRTLAMPALLAEVLKKRRLTNKDPEGLVFCTSSGKPYDPAQVLKRCVHPVLAQLGFSRVGWRAFRHTVATLLQDLGEPVKIAQEQLGHSNPSTTLGIYTHALPDTQRDAVERMSNLLFPDVPKWLH